MRAQEFDPTLQEGWRDTMAGLALGAGVAMGSPAQATGTETVVVQPGQTVYSIARAFGTTPQVIQRLNRLGSDFQVKPNQELKVPVPPNLRTTKIDPKPAAAPSRTQPASNKKSPPAKTLTGGRYESLITQAARRGGITDPVELAAFLAQVAVETGGFNKLKEQGNRRYIERMYDRAYNPRAVTKLGNVKVGDGWRYRGRGFLQITGRYNYGEAGKAIGVNLIKNPEALMDPKNAADASVWYWKWRVRPNVTDFNDTEAITRLVQGGDKHLDRREDAFADFKQFKLAKI